MFSSDIDRSPDFVLRGALGGAGADLIADGLWIAFKAMRERSTASALERDVDQRESESVERPGRVGEGNS